MSKLKAVWILVDGSIFTRDFTGVIKTPTKTMKCRESIAFNVGDEIGRSIVSNHNEQLKRIGDVAEWPNASVSKAEEFARAP